MSIHKTAGAKFYFSPTTVSPDTINALGDATAIAQFTAVSNWIEVGEVENLGELGDSSQPVTFTAIGNRRVRKLKGPKDAGVHTIVCGRDPLDVGQIALLTALSSDQNFRFRVQLADVPPGTTTQTNQYYAGLVMSGPTQHGDVAAVTRRSFAIGINTAVYEVPAS